MKKMLLVVSLIGIVSYAHADNNTWGRTKNGAGVTTNEAALQVSSVTTVSNSTATVIASTPTSVTYTGTADNFNYITDIHIEMYAIGTLTGGALPVQCTTTNLPGNPVFTFPTAAAIGTVVFYNIDYVFPLRSTTVGTQTTISCPGRPNVGWNIVLNYYQDD